MTRVLIIDDHPIVMEGCQRLLRDAGVCEIAEAGSLVAGYRLYRRGRPEVIILDLSLNGSDLSGLAFLKRLRARDSDTGILIFSMHGEAVIVKRAIEAGANGYLLKDTSSAEFLKAFNRVRAGRQYLSPEMAAEIAFFGSGRGADPKAALTIREMEMLALLADGKSYGDIAEQLGLSYKTVANIASQLKSKLNARSLPELIHHAIRHTAMQ
ncbi:MULTISPECIES: response regulator transcription factor [Rhodomicrobium]|uniref:response regulator transcription factor n=1 Tax=Rhodomicrobium TaxID=1068 RepID=UPI000B4B75A8|nr:MULTISPECIES: response regulator transcription factor [Rhodomicrobium]